MWEADSEEEEMKSRRTRIIVAALALAALGAVAVSQTMKRAHWRHGGMMGEHMIAFFAHKLDLTDAQQTQMKDILAKEKPGLQPLFQQLAQGHQQMRALEESGTFDEAQVRAVAAQQSQTITELMVQKARIESEMVQLLNADQKAKFKEFMDQREKRFAERMQPPAGSDGQTQQ
jgi:Spy/CpxP family protein refolding chaperone